MANQPTLADIADQAGVSVPVVSAVLNPSAKRATVRYSDDVGERVRAIATRLGYRRRANRVYHSEDKTHVAVLVPGQERVDDRMVGPFLQGVTGALRRSQYQPETCFESSDVDRQRLAELAEAGRLAGVVAMNWRSDTDAWLADMQVPVVWANPMGPVEPRIVPDEVAGASQALKFVRACGRSTVAYVDAPGTHPSVFEREHAVTHQCESLGLTLHGVVDGAELNEAVVSDLLGAGVDTIITYHGHYALEVLLALKGLGRSTGSDVGLISLSGQGPCASVCDLTYVDMVFDHLGRACADYLVDSLNGCYTHQVINLPPVFHVGETCMSPLKESQ